MMMSRTLLLLALTAQATAFVPTAFPSLMTRRTTAPISLRMVAVKPKTGVGSNGMNDDGFTRPLVEKVALPGVSHGYEYRVIEDSVDVKKLNAAEKLKLAKGGMRIIDDIESLAAEAKEKGGAQFMDEDDINIRLKWLGLFHRAKIAPGTFMWRLRIHNGQLTTAQWKVLTKQIKEYDTENDRNLWSQMGCADVTTRQNIQLRGIRLENLPRHWKELTDAGMTSVQAGMDNVRNLVGNPLAGIDPEEIIDTRPYCEEFTAKLTDSGKGNPALANLPRKFNVCYVGSKEMFEHPDINDIAYLPAKDKDGNMGWNIDVGGLLMSTRCEFAIPMDAFVPLEKHWELGAAIMTTFRDFGFRYNPRTKTRLMFLIDNMGMEAFREEVARRYKEATGLELGKAETGLVPKVWKRRELLGANKQADGDNWIGMVVPAGRMYADEMEAVGKISETYGNGNIRLTVEGNILVLGVPDSKLEAALKECATIERLETAPRPALKGTVACAGNQFCGQSKINTKGHAVRFANFLDNNFDFPPGKDVRLHWTGCPNTCGQIQLGDIGLLGVTCKNSKGEIVEGVDLYLGGGIGQTAAIGTLYKSKIPIEEGLEVSHPLSCYALAVRRAVMT